MTERLAQDQVGAVADILNAHGCVFLTTDELNHVYRLCSGGQRLPPLSVASIAPAWNTLRLCAANLITTVAKVDQAALLYRHPSDVARLASVLLSAGHYSINAVLDCFAFVTGRKLATELKKAAGESICDMLRRASVPEWTVSESHVLVSPPALYIHRLVESQAIRSLSATVSSSASIMATAANRRSNNSIWNSCLFIPETLEYPLQASVNSVDMAPLSSASSSSSSSLSSSPQYGDGQTAPNYLTTRSYHQTISAHNQTSPAFAATISTTPTSSISSISSNDINAQNRTVDDEFSKTVHKRLYNRRASNTISTSSNTLSRDHCDTTNYFRSIATAAPLFESPPFYDMDYSLYESPKVNTFDPRSTPINDYSHNFSARYSVSQKCAIDSMAYNPTHNPYMYFAHIHADNTVKYDMA